MAGGAAVPDWHQKADMLKMLTFLEEDKPWNQTGKVWQRLSRGPGRPLRRVSARPGGLAGGDSGSCWEARATPRVLEAGQKA